MKLAIVGSRGLLVSEESMNQHVGAVHSMHYGNQPMYNPEIVSGGARGIDHCAKKYAQYYDFKYKEFPADWDQHGRRAGYLRNVDIVNYSDAVLAFWDGESRGTMHSVKLARDAGKTCVIIVLKEAK